jgi:hypothetical protein
MKLMLICAVIALAFAAGCSTPTQTTNNAPEKSASASPTAPPSTAAPQQQSGSNISDEEMIAREKQIWETLKQRNYKAFADMLAEDQFEITPNGSYDKAATLTQVQGTDFSGVQLSDFKVIKIDKDAAIVAYLVKGPIPAFSIAGERHSRVWANRNGKWLAVFHQSTLVSGTPPVTAPPSGTGKPQGTLKPTN